MPDTVQKYKDFVITSFLKSVQPIVFEKASGAIVTDVNGREYLDCFAGISVVNAGHNHPHVIAAAKAQMDKLVHCASYIYHCQPTADLAEKIAELAPGSLSKTFFGNGGAEAIEGPGFDQLFNRRLGHELQIDTLAELECILERAVSRALAASQPKERS